MQPFSPSPQLVSMLESYDAPAVLLSTDYRILAANRHYRNAFGSAPGRRCYEVSHRYTLPCDQAGETCPLKQTLETGQPHRVFHLHHTPRGDEHMDVEIHPLRDANGSVSCFLEVMNDSHLASPDPKASGLVGRAPSFNRVLELVARVAPSETAVLLLGESGTGKELVAQAVHDASPRAKGPFVPVECSGLTETLFESELFGHEKGAFTGAQAQKIGLVEAANGGTLFLDEIGDIPLTLQVKLLRLLETGTYRRVGGIEPHKSDFRLIGATHRNLKSMVESGTFRQDLYYRINTFPVELPALRARIEDLSLLVDALFQRAVPGRKLRLAAETLALLQNYRFPGNIRELRNILERAALLTDGDLVLPEHLPEECRIGADSHRPSGPMPFDIMPLDKVEGRYLRWVLARFHGEKRQLAERLGVSERTLYRKLQGLKDA